jgi:hypothetical protein
MHNISRSQEGDGKLYVIGVHNTCAIHTVHTGDNSLETLVWIHHAEHTGHDAGEKTKMGLRVIVDSTTLIYIVRYKRGSLLWIPILQCSVCKNMIRIPAMEHRSCSRPLDDYC